MTEENSSQTNWVDYEAWVEERRKLRKPRMTTDEMYPVAAIPEKSWPEAEIGAEEELAILGGPTAEVDRALAAAAERRSRPKKTICTCGHSMTFHFEAGGRTQCAPGRQWCRCMQAIGVLRPDDARYFVYATTGSGPLHALTKGIRSMQRKGVQAELIVPKACFQTDCHRPTDRLIPIMYNRDGFPTHSTGVVTYLFCETCVVRSGLTMHYEPLR